MIMEMIIIIKEEEYSNPLFKILKDGLKDKDKVLHLYETQINDSKITQLFFLFIIFNKFLLPLSNLK
jgi:hypothetical protein